MSGKPIDTRVQREALESLMKGERVDVFHVREGVSIPEGARIGRLVVHEAIAPPLPDRLRCREFTASGSSIEAFRDTWEVTDRLDLSNCASLTTLPSPLRVPSIKLRGCRRLAELPSGLHTHFLDLTGCEWLEALPEDLHVSLGRLLLRDCRRLNRLPESIGPLARLDVAGCPLLTQLPQSLEVRSVIDIGGTGIRALPPGCRRAQIHWRGVPIDERIAFRPEEIAGREVLEEDNAERRRVMLDRVGFERFIAEVDAEVLDTDTDAGGERRLFRVAMTGDEDLVCVSVRCPSTGRQYLLRVPPKIRSCHAAVAWTAGFDDPADYRPLVET